MPRYLRVEARERVRANGLVERDLDEGSLDQTLDYLAREGAESLCRLLPVFLPQPVTMNNGCGKRYASVSRTQYTSLSHQVIPQIKEFDRLSTTVINSYVGPVFSGYLEQVEGAVRALPTTERSADNAVQRRRRTYRRLQPDGGAGHPVRPRRRGQRRGAHRSIAGRAENNRLRHGRHQH